MELEMNIVGLDLETTGLDMNLGHRMIQIGISFGVLDTICHDVFPVGPIVCDPEAMAINKFSEARIIAGTPNGMLDILLVEELKQRGAVENSLYIVGWNVGWDREFVRKELPLTAKFICRPIDLTGIAIARQVKSGGNPDDWRKNQKEAIQKDIAGILGYSNYHDAGHDAKAALLAFHLLTRP